MNQHYYTQQPTSAHQFRKISVSVLGCQLSFTTDSGVFSRDGLDPGTRILLESIGPVSGSFLDLACGWGPVGIAVAKAYPQAAVTMTDVNLRAVELARHSAAENGVQPTIVSGDGFENVQGCFNTIAVNPPIRAGKQVIYAMFAQAMQRLLPGGKLYVVIRKQQGAESALKFIKEISANAEVIEKSGGYWVICAEA